MTVTSVRSIGHGLQWRCSFCLAAIHDDDARVAMARGGIPARGPFALHWMHYACGPAWVSLMLLEGREYGYDVARPDLPWLNWARYGHVWSGTMRI